MTEPTKSFKELFNAARKTEGYKEEVMTEPTKTPRSDMARILGDEGCVNLDFARTLERELSEATKDRDQWKAMAEELAAVIKLCATPESYNATQIEAVTQALTRFREMKGDMNGTQSITNRI